MRIKLQCVLETGLLLRPIFIHLNIHAVQAASTFLSVLIFSTSEMVDSSHTSASIIIPFRSEI